MKTGLQDEMPTQDQAVKGQGLTQGKSSEKQGPQSFEGHVLTSAYTQFHLNTTLRIQAHCL